MQLRPRTTLFALVLFPMLVSAQGLPPGTTVSNATLTVLGQFDTDFDAGGSFGWYGAFAAGNVLRQYTAQFAGGLSVRYDYEEWDFSNPSGFGGQAPWRNVNRPQFGATFVYAPTSDWRLILSPSVEWAYESGASTGDSLIYGAVAIASRAFTPSLTLGVGAAVYRQIYKTKASPFLVIDWKIDDRWRLANPFPAGPAGGAGLELTYAWSEAWETGFGGSYRSYEFRLDSEGAVPGGIGQQRYVPLFLRVTSHLDRRSTVDFYAAALVNGRLSVKNPNGGDVANENYRTAPVLGLTFQHRF